MRVPADRERRYDCEVDVSSRTILKRLTGLQSARRRENRQKIIPIMFSNPMKLTARLLSGVGRFLQEQGKSVSIFHTIIARGVNYSYNTYFANSCVYTKLLKRRIYAVLELTGMYIQLQRELSTFCGVIPLNCIYNKHIKK